MLTLACSLALFAFTLVLLGTVCVYAYLDAFDGMRNAYLYWRAWGRCGRGKLRRVVGHGSQR